MIVNSAHDLVPRSDWAVIPHFAQPAGAVGSAAFAGDVEDLSDYVIDRNEGIAGLAIDEGQVINVGDTQSIPVPLPMHGAPACAHSWSRRFSRATGR